MKAFYCKKIRRDCAAFLYAELEKEERERFLSHLKSCPSCRGELERLEEVKRGAESLNEDIEKAMASVDWEALPLKIAEAAFKKQEAKETGSLLAKTYKAVFRLEFKPVFAALLSGVIIGSLLTFFILRSPFKKPERVETLSVPGDYIERVELEMARRETLDYLEKSQYLILDFIQTSPESEASLWERKFASQRAKDLLSKKKYINPQLDKFRMAKAKEICDQIEFLFYELALEADQVPAWRLKEIHDFIEEKQLLLKIRLLKRELEETEKSEV